MSRCILFRRRLGSDERVYGLGDRLGPLDRRGRRYVLWNRDTPNLALGREPRYRSVAVLFGVGPRHAWGVHVDSAARLEVDCRGDEVRLAGPRGAPVRYVEGERFPDVLGRLSAQVGRTPLPPRWALGYHQSRWSYASAQEALEVVAGFRRRDIPLDALHLDIDYMDGYRVFTWHPERFPDPAALVRELGVPVVAIVDPGVKLDPGYRVYEELVARGYACMRADGRPWVGRVWPGRCVFPDFSSAEVRGWWAGLHRVLVDAGVEGIWTDMNEPASEAYRTMPGAVRQQAGRHAELHNAYGHWMAQAAHEALARLRPGRRPFVLTRAGYAGTQRYAATWTGDNRSSWGHVDLALRACLGLGLSLWPFCGADVGGFVGRASPELYARWMQLGAFTPFFRTHYAGRLTPGRQEPWSFGPEAEVVARAAIDLRHRLLPYTYTAFWRHRETGLPVMRALALEWQDDPRAAATTDAFLWGDDLLVAPVLRPGERRREVYLPRGDWHDFWTGARHAGPASVSVEAPLDRIPLFVRGGSVLPLAGGELRLYPGLGTSWLYEDDGETESAPSSLTRFDVDGDAVSVRREGEFPSAYA